jgi:hypothetical protein
VRNKILVTVAYLLTGVILLPLNIPAIERGYYQVPILGLASSTLLAFGILWLIMSTTNHSRSPLSWELGTIAIAAWLFVASVSLDLSSALDGDLRSVVAGIGTISGIFFVVSRASESRW